ncbi:MAG: hypothetical protein PHW13_13465 [Methylococcales bacterium]|nr:hypothetical protein [Methylococcales bacterium]
MKPLIELNKPQNAYDIQRFAMQIAKENKLVLKKAACHPKSNVSERNIAWETAAD